MKKLKEGPTAEDAERRKQRRGLQELQEEATKRILSTFEFTLKELQEYLSAKKIQNHAEQTIPLMNLKRTEVRVQV